jgi:predicted methyltransferase
MIENLMKSPVTTIARLVLLGLVTAAVSAPLAAQHRSLFPPEHLGLLEGPDRAAWQRPEEVMDALLIAEGSTVADLGAGGGWFTMRLAERVGPNGRVYAEDVQKEMIEAIRRRVDSFHEMRQPVVMLRAVTNALKPNGRVGIIEYTKKGFGPGPPMEERADPERVIREAEAAGLRLLSMETFIRYQYMLVFTRK